MSLLDDDAQGAQFVRKSARAGLETDKIANPGLLLRLIGLGTTPHLARLPNGKVFQDDHRCPAGH